MGDVFHLISTIVVSIVKSLLHPNLASTIFCSTNNPHFTETQSFFKTVNIIPYLHFSSLVHTSHFHSGISISSTQSVSFYSSSLSLSPHHSLTLFLPLDFKVSIFPTSISKASVLLSNSFMNSFPHDLLARLPPSFLPAYSKNILLTCQLAAQL